MDFTEIKNSNLEPISKVKMNADGLLAEDIPPPLPKNSGFNMVINGPSGSGKTNLLVNILKKRAKNGKRQSLRRVFDSVVIVSPSLKSLSNNIFEDLDEKKKYTKFDEDMLDGLDEILEEMSDMREEEERNFYTLLILDDVGSQIKRNKANETRFATLLQNRRHLGGGGLSVISITQKHRDMPLSIRNNLTHYISFLPKNQAEKEAIYGEYVSEPKKYMNEFFNYFFSNKYDTMLIDMSNPPFDFYHNWNKVLIN